MKGEIFNLFEKFISDSFGDQKYFSVFQKVCPHLATKQPFVGPGTYPDSDMMLIVGEAVNQLGIPLSDAMRAFGQFCLPQLLQKMPSLMATHSHPKSLILAVENVIHVEVRKLYRDSVLPRFHYEDCGPSELVVIYQSPRRLYDFVEGMLIAAGNHFSCPIKIERSLIQFEGDEATRYHLTFEHPMIENK